jgi:cell envelope opacity-associated protein A
VYRPAKVQNTNKDIQKEVKALPLSKTYCMCQNLKVESAKESMKMVRSPKVSITDLFDAFEYF